jgi:hypothetical protein
MSVADLSALNSPLSPLSGSHVRAVHDEFHGDLLEVSMGPHHPSTHGVFRMIVTLDGETIVKLKPVFGYPIATTRNSARTSPISRRCPTPTGSTTSRR